MAEYERVKLTDAHLGGRCNKYLDELAALIATHGTGEGVRLTIPNDTSKEAFTGSLIGGAKTRGFKTHFRTVNGHLIGWVERLKK